MSKTTPLTPLTMLLKDAIRWTKKWQDNNKSHAKAFRIHADDILACFNEMGVTFSTDANGKSHVVIDKYMPCVRGYMAIDDKGTEHILFVGTTTDDGEHYKDIIGDPNSESTYAAVGNPTGSGIYDFTTPCPNDCDPGSPLIND